MASFLKKLTHRAVIGVMMCVGLASCSKPEQATLLITYTGNVHGAIFPYDFKADTATKLSLANASTFIHDMRGIFGAENSLTLDVGGTMTGRPEAYYSNYIDTLHEPMYYRAERLIGYDAIGLAQHDLDVSECLSPRRRSPSYDRPIICANIIDSRTRKPYFQPYKVFKRAGVKVAVLGLTSPEINAILPKSEWRYIQTQDMVECAHQWVDYIKEHEAPDVLIGLLGTSRKFSDPANDVSFDSYKNPNGALPTAIRVPGFDIVYLADDADERMYEVTNDAGKNVKVVNVGVLGRNVGSTIIHLTKEEDGSYTKRIFNSIARTSRFAVDSTFVKVFEEEFKGIHQWMNEPLGSFSEPIYPARGLSEPSSYRALIHEAQLWYTDADISLTGILTSTPVFKSGSVCMRDLLDFYKFENYLMTLSMTGEELHRLLEYTYGLQFQQMHGPDDQMLAFAKDPFGHILYDPQGHPYLSIRQSSYLSAGGIVYSVDVSKPVGERVTITSMKDGRPFDPRSNYMVVINSFHGLDGDNLLTKGIGWNKESLQMHVRTSELINIREAISEYIKDRRTVPAPDARPEWTLLPTEWTRRAQERNAKNPAPVWK